jgi:CheY-like chemotaxis protein
MPTSGRNRKAAVKRPRRPAASARRVEETLAALAHDIRTPLTAILALGELLATSDLGDRERGWATAIKTTAEHLASLTSLIVDGARAEAKGLILRPTLFRPRHFADSLGASLSARAGAKGIGSVVTVADDLPDVATGDIVRLRGAMENLIDNAVKFTERGSVDLDIRWQAAARKRVRLIFLVTDSGIGLSAAEIRRLFRPFTQANEQIARRYGGAGLGLAFVKRIARAMGGDLTVVSRRGGGSTFRLSVIVDPGMPTGVDADADFAGIVPPPERPLTILCVEDNPFGRVVLNTIVTGLGHHADFAGTGEAAVEAVAARPYDAVLMDVTLPGIDGFEAARRMLILPDRSPVIIGISGHASAEEEARARAAGMAGYLAKPPRPNALAEILPR